MACVFLFFVFTLCKEKSLTWYKRDVLCFLLKVLKFCFLNLFYWIYLKLIFALWYKVEIWLYFSSLIWMWWLLSAEHLRGPCANLWRFLLGQLSPLFHTVLLPQASLFSKWILSSIRSFQGFRWLCLSSSSLCRGSGAPSRL